MKLTTLQTLKKRVYINRANDCDCNYCYFSHHRNSFLSKLYQKKLRYPNYCKRLRLIRLMWNYVYIAQMKQQAVQGKKWYCSGYKDSKRLCSLSYHQSGGITVKGMAHWQIWNIFCKLKVMLQQV